MSWAQTTGEESSITVTASASAALASAERTTLCGSGTAAGGVTVLKATPKSASASWLRRAR